MIITYRYRLLPRRQQHRALERILEAQRQLYNAALEERIDAYRKRGIARTYLDQTRALTEWRRDDPEARSLPVSLQRATLKRLEDAFTGFFNRTQEGGKPGFPGFRGKDWFASFGFRYFQGITLRDGKLRFKGLPGPLRVHMHRPMPSSAIRNCTFCRDGKQWFVGFSVEVPTPETRESVTVVGLDLGLTTLATMSDGSTIPRLRARKEVQRKLRVAQRKMARRQRYSKGRHKARMEIGQCHRKARQCRSNHLHQAAATLVERYDVIAIEALHVEKLAKGMLAAEVRDASWSRFISFLKYKAERAGAKVIEVDPRGTTKECSQCGAIVAKSLAQRSHQCPDCGITMDRDLNAARNIVNRAGVGPGLLNVAVSGMRAGDKPQKDPLLLRDPAETRPYMCSPPS